MRSRGRGARTPIYGFGDRCSTIELFPYDGLFCTRTEAPRKYSIEAFKLQQFFEKNKLNK